MGCEAGRTVYRRSGQGRELWYTRAISIVIPQCVQGDDVGRFRDDEFARSGDAARRPELRVFGEEMFDAVQDVHHGRWMRMDGRGAGLSR
jgi:hypothetical protein